MNDKQRRSMVLATRIAAPVAVVLFAGLVVLVLVETGPRVRVTDAAPRPSQVQVFEARRVEVHRQWRGYGTAEPLDSADVPARVTATVQHIPDDILPGTRVERGQLLVQLDPSDFQRRAEIARQNLQQIQAQLAALAIEEQRLTEQLEIENQTVAIARRELDRLEKLFDAGAARQADLDNSKRALLSARRTRLDTAEALELLAPRRRRLEAEQAAQEASLRLAKLEVQRSSIESPIGGVLQAVDVERGESVAAGQQVARVVSLDTIEVPLKLPATARPSIGAGDSVLLRPTNEIDCVWPATVSRIAPEDDPRTRTTTVYVTVEQGPILARKAEGGSVILLSPGLFVSGTVTSGQTQTRWVAPRRAVRDGRVLVAEQGVVTLVPVEVDYVIEADLPQFHLPDNQWVVLNVPGGGLEQGDLVLVNASQSVQAGQRIRPVRVEPDAIAER